MAELAYLHPLTLAVPIYGIDASQRIHLLDRTTGRGQAGFMAHIQSSTRIPALWTVAYGPHRPVPVRLLARTLLRVRAFARELALADHVPSGGY